MDFTWIQLRQFQSYEKVRSSGKYTMFDPRAQRASGLNKDEYLFVMQNYDALNKQYEEDQHDSHNL